MQANAPQQGQANPPQQGQAAPQAVINAGVNGIIVNPGGQQGVANPDNNMTGFGNVNNAVMVMANGNDPVTMDLSYDDVMNALSTGFEFDIFELFQFLGLDPTIIYKELLRCALKPEPLTIAEFVSSIEKILIWYIQRGTSIERVDLASRSKNGVPDWVNALRTRYGIDQNLKGNRSPNHLTISRIVVCFPYPVSAAFGVGLKDPIATEAGLPASLSFPQAAAMMSDEEWVQYRMPFLRCMVKFTRAINRGQTNLMTAQGPAQVNVQGGLNQVQYPNAPQLNTQALNVSQMTDQQIMDMQENFANAARASAFSKARRVAWRRCQRALHGVLLATIRAGPRGQGFQPKEAPLPELAG